MYSCRYSSSRDMEILPVFSAVLCLSLHLLSVHGQQLAVTSLPNELFSGGSRTIVEGSVVWLYCQVDSKDTDVMLTWTKDNISLVQDVPHIRMRTSRINDDKILLLVVDSIQASDSGVYQCTAEDGGVMAMGTALTLTASTSTTGSLRVTSSNAAGGSTFFMNRAGYQSGDTATLQYDVSHVGDATMTFAPPTVTWLRDGVPASATPTNTPGMNGRLSTTLSFPFAASDAGVYQCVFTDTARSEVFVTDPIRLDTGETLTVQGISPSIPSVVLLRPPEKLVLEISATGRYFFTLWSRNNIYAGLSGFSTPSFAHFQDTYYAEATTMDDLGRYEATLEPIPNSNLSPTDIQFAVVSPVDTDTSVSSGGGVVTVREGGSVNISCTSTGVPVPTISWTLNNQPAPFNQLPGQPMDPIANSAGGLITSVTPGSVESTLQIVTAQYPAHDGVYMCTGSNTHTGVTTTSSAMVTVQVLVLPVVNVTADRTRVVPGGAATLTCTVTRGNPMAYTYSWTHEGTPLTGENSATLSLSSFSMDMVGAYSCEVTNNAGVGMDTITIQLGVVPSVTARVSPPGPVVNGSTVSLVCEATAGDTPISYLWTGPSGQGVSPADTDGTISVTPSASGDYGNYTCTATNEFGTGLAAAITVIIAVPAVVELEVGQVTSPEVMAEGGLTLSVTISGFNLPVTSISWTQQGSTLTGSEDRVTITNTPMLPAASSPVKSTFVLTGVTPGETGSYTVTASNSAGNTTFEFSVSVTDSASFIDPLVHTTVMEDERGMVIFTCTARGVPEPSITWSPASGDRIQVSSTPAVSEADGYIFVNSTLTISNLMRGDAGDYSCTASNTVMGGAVTDDRTITLTVNFAPSITMDPVSSVELLWPAPLSLTCTADGVPPPNITWVRTLSNGSETEFSMASMDVGGRIFSIVSSSNITSVQSNFTIDSTLVLDTANYSCRASNRLATVESSPSSVSVYAAPSISTPMQFQTAELGNITFTCTASGFPAPSISFLRGSNALTNTAGMGTLGQSIFERALVGVEEAVLNLDGMYVVTRNLDLFHVEDGDTGTFTCVALASIPGIGDRMDMATFDLTVLIGAMITTPPMDQLVIFPGSATFTCSAEGFPRPDITWFVLINGGPRDLPAEDRFMVQSMNGVGEREVTSSLTITNMQPLLSGMYVCNASNTVGMDMDIASLTVHTVPEITLPPEGIVLTVDQFQPVIFSCAAAGIPAPNITWTREQNGENTTLQASSSITINDPVLVENYELQGVIGGVTGVNRSLTLNEAVDGDSGSYFCIANSTSGDDSRGFQLMVRVAASITRIPDDVTVTSPRSATFSCSASGRPRPSIIWVDPSSTVLMSGVNGFIIGEMEEGERGITSTLNIASTAPSVGGEYRCLTENGRSGRGNLNESRAVLTVYVSPVVTSVMNYTVNQTDTAVFECSATGIPAPSITWFRDGIMLDDADSRVTYSNPTDAVAVMDGAGEMILEVNRTLMLSMSEDEDSGSYECRANNSAMPGEDSRSFELIVQIPPDTPEVGERAVTVTQPNEAMFVCNAMASPRPFITWYRLEMDNSRTILTGTEEGVSVTVGDGDTERTRNSTLVFSPSRPFFSAEYICEATNVVASAEISVTLTVNVSPVVTSVMNYTVNQTDTAIFECSATGIPAPSITWFRDGMELDGSDPHVTYNDPTDAVTVMDGAGEMILEVNRTLMLSMSEDEDSGSYECRANNSAMPGEDSRSFELTVQIPPDVPIIVGERAVTVTQPGEAMFVCTAMARPRPSITWYRVEMDSSRTILTGTEEGVSVTVGDGDTERTRNSTLVFSPSRPFFSAEYICEASNVVASAEINVTLTVNVSPVVTSVMNYTVNQTNTATFECSATGIPAPFITWFRGGMELNGTDPRVTYNDPSDAVTVMDGAEEILEVTRTLTLSMSEDSDSGSYECRASNDAMPGENRRSFELIVQIPPDTPEVGERAVTVTQPNDAMIVCTAMARPRPSITWYRLEMDNSRTILTGTEEGVSVTVGDGDTERIRNSTLVFSPSRPFFSAEYICEATNVVASAEISVNLTVNVSPVVTSVMNYTVNQTDTATFECSATGIPTPSITWFRGGTELDRDDSRVMFNDPDDAILFTESDGDIVFEVTRTLALSLSEDGDSGSYQCIASNDAGEDSRSFNLIVQIPPDVPVVVGERAVTVTQPGEAMFVCTAMARPRPSITWYRVERDNSRTILTGTEEGVSVTVGDGDTDRTRNSTLVFSPSCPFFSAEYICEATNVVVSAEISVNLTVNVSPVVTSVMNYTVNQTDTAVFECSATGIPAPSIIWFRDGMELDGTDPHVTYNDPTDAVTVMDGAGEIILEVTRTLMLSMSEDEDSGSYECRASNNAMPGEGSGSFELTVQIPPDVLIIVGERAVTVTQPNDAMFVCTAMARPRPSITWYRVEMDNSRTILTGTEEGVSVTVGDGDTDRTRNSTLVFSPSRPFFSAEYICEATNVVDSAKVNTTLTVCVNPNITFSLPPDDTRYVVNVSNPITFECSATGVPPPTIQWYRGGELLDPSMDSRFNLSVPAIDAPPRGLATARRTLTISSVTADNAGSTYSCNATNTASVGVASETFELFVQVSPVVVPIMQRVVGNESESAILRFRIDNAIPMVTLSDIHWYYTANTVSGVPEFSSGDFLEITNSSSRTSNSVLTFSTDLLTLNVSNIVQARQLGEETDAGRYFLRASNSAGEGSNYIDLVVTGPPQIVGGPLNQFVVNDGSSAVFECEALAEPEHEIQWSFTNSNGNTMNRIISTDVASSSSKYFIGTDRSATFGVLTVNSVEFGDRGIYTCLAVNEIGDEEARANLTVHVIPIVHNITDPDDTLLDQPVAIFCQVTGYPLPAITWQQDGASIVGGDTGQDRINVFTFYEGFMRGTNSSVMYTDFAMDMLMSLGELGVVSVLSVDSVARGDTGNYSCTATNQLPQTRTITTTSDTVPLVILERPDPPTSVSTISAGARWIALSWIPTFDGNRPVLRFIQYIRNVNISENFSQVANLTTSDVMARGSGGGVMYNVSREGAVFPFTQYSFRVESCNEIGCSEQSTESDTRLTDQDTAVAPDNLVVASTDSTALTLEWGPPPTPNGIITAYRIVYNGVKPYDQSFTESGDSTRNLSELQTIGGVVRSVLADLTPGTTYTVMVAGVNGASSNNGVGMTASIQENTQSLAPPPPVILPLEALPTPANIPGDIRSVVIPLPQFSTINGVISHYQVVVVILPVGQTQDDLIPPDTLYPSRVDLDVHSASFCNQDFSTAKAYITAEFGGDLFPSNGLFVVGGEGDSSPNDRPLNYTNGLLCFSKQYTFFVRAYPQLETLNNGRRFARQALERQYAVFSSSSYYAPTTVGSPMILQFQLRLESVPDCSEWTNNDPIGKVNQIVQEVANELSQRCQCSFEAGQITSAGFRCFPESPTAVTFRAEISEPGQLLASELMSFLQAWTSSGGVILVQAQILSVDSNCAVLISSFTEGECAASDTGSDGATGGDITLIGAVVGAVLGLVLVVVIAVSIPLLLCIRKRKGKVDLTIPIQPGYDSVVYLNKEPQSPMGDVNEEHLYDYVKSPLPLPEEVSGDIELNACPAYETHKARPK